MYPALANASMSPRDQTSGDYLTLSSAEALSKRKDILEQIQQEFSQLNQQFQDDPNKVDIQTINELFSNLREVNQAVAKRKEELKTQKNTGILAYLGIKNISKASLTTASLNAVAWLAQTANQSYQISSENPSNGTDTGDPENKGREIGLLGVTVLGLFLSVIVGGLINAAEQDNDRRVMLAKLKRIDENEQKRGEEMQAFVKSFNEFKQSIHPEANANPKDQHASLKQCVHLLDQIPSKDGQQIPSRDHWISLLIQMLPEDHPIKQKISELKDVAIKAILEAESSELTQRKVRRRKSRPKEAAVRQTLSPKIETSSSEGSSGKENPFLGERLSFNAMNKREVSLCAQEVIRITNKKKCRDFREGWYELENELGFALPRLQMDGKLGCDRHGRMAPSIEVLGARAVPRNTAATQREGEERINVL